MQIQKNIKGNLYVLEDEIETDVQRQTTNGCRDGYGKFNSSL